MNEVSLTNNLLQLNLTIAVAGYEFPNSRDKNDAEWLLIKTSLALGEKRFHNISPSLEAKDLTEIAIWFDTLARRHLPRWISMSFLEPNLEFKVYRSTDEFVRLGVVLSHESSPPFRLTTWGEDALCIFEFTYADLAEIAASFHRIAEQFPSKIRDVDKENKEQQFSGELSSRVPQTRH